MNPSVCFRIEAPPHEVERLIAELHSMGTLGVEEREGGSGRAGSFSVLLVYFSAAHVPAAEILGPNTVRSSVKEITTALSHRKTAC